MKKIVWLSGIILLLMSTGPDPRHAAGRDPDAYNPFDMDNEVEAALPVDPTLQNGSCGYQAGGYSEERGAL